MRLLIAGTRTFKLRTEDLFVFLKLNGLLHDVEGLPQRTTEIVSGGAPGVDSCAIALAQQRNISFKIFGAEWDKYGKLAGPIRNRKMAVYADRLLLIWDGESPGSKNMKEEMLKLNKPVYEVVLRTHNDVKVIK